MVDGDGAGVEADGARREASRELRRDGADAVLRQGVVAEGEALEDELEEAGRRVQRRVEEYPGEERPQEPLHDGGREPELRQVLPRGRLRRREDDVVRGGGRAEAREPNEDLVGEGAHGGEHRGEGTEREAERVGEQVERLPGADEDKRAGVEGPEPERREVEEAPALRVRGEEDLEAPVQAVPVHHVGGDAAAEAVRGLDERERHGERRQVRRRGEAREPASDNDGLAGGRGARRRGGRGHGEAERGMAVGLGRRGEEVGRGDVHGRCACSD